MMKGALIILLAIALVKGWKWVCKRIDCAHKWEEEALKRDKI